ncbi:MAG: tyrosine--tRNA ligase [Patescibacteria group bacterium]|jgi:tyrosyl-tRNA synthetase|nr:tyrosine--tRNA ligase [Patescibacteria group bacterium]|tara:strand:- start:9272 stop:10477 length:1206 start_codon:yes stop_codon:yes gene_type:complete
MPKKQEQIHELLTRGVDQVVVKKDLEKLLKSNKKLKVYHGIDPTSTQIHIGNAIPLRKLAQFQELGHQVIFLVGSFTALIGDTSDKTAMRKVMTNEEIKSNFKTYKEQASKILDFKKAKILYNGDWLSKLSFEDIVKLAQEFTVQQMIERDMYQKRLHEGKPIGLHEFLYPLMQGYDSVHMEVDVEIGGSDQLFNMLAGRSLLKSYKNKEKHVLTIQLLEGLDGRKMSKSYNNTVNIADEPNDMFGKIMSLHDDLIIRYFELCTNIPMVEIHEIGEALKNGDNPKNAKVYLAREIVKLYHNDKESKSADKEFENVFSKGEDPNDMLVVRFRDLPLKLMNSKSTSRLIVEIGLASSNAEAQRLVEQGGVRIDGKKAGKHFKEDLKDGVVVRVGKRKFVEIKD